MLPAVAEMIYIKDTGRHETCTAFALLLKLGQAQPEVVLPFLKSAVENDDIPEFFGTQLIEKVKADRLKHPTVMSAQQLDVETL